jgi:hypothetical protein
VLRSRFESIRDSVLELIGKQMDALARQFAATHDLKGKEEINRLAKECGKLKQPWVSVGRE